MKDQISKDNKEKFMEGGFSEGVGYGDEQNLESSYTPVPDDELRSQILKAIEEDIHVDSTNVSVEVHYGEVILAGSVPNRAMMNAATECVQGISGVKKLTNELQIKVV